MLMLGFFMGTAIAQDDDKDLAALDPAVRTKALEEKLGKDFIENAKNVTDAAGAIGNLANLKSTWQSAPVVKDPEIYGVDVSSIFNLEEIAEPVGFYHYSAFGKADPFMPPYDQYRQARVVAFEIPIVSPLQVPLTTLRVSGLWQLDNGTRKALILTDKDEGIIAAIGDPIGLSGKIVDIQDHGVLTRQYRIRTDGSREFTDVTLAFGETKSRSSEKILLEPGKDPTLAAPAKEETSGKVLTPIRENTSAPVANSAAAPPVPLPGSTPAKTEGVAAPAQGASDTPTPPPPSGQR